MLRHSSADTNCVINGKSIFWAKQIWQCGHSLKYGDRICFCDSTKLIEVLSLADIISPFNWSIISFFFIDSSGRHLIKHILVSDISNKDRAVAGTTVLGIKSKKSRIYLSLEEFMSFLLTEASNESSFSKLINWNTFFKNLSLSL